MLTPCPPIIVSVEDSYDIHERAPNMLFVAELTTRCNLRCSHCYSSSHPHIVDPSFMTLKKWMTAFLWARRMEYQKLQFIGGEATLHPHFIELLAFSSSLGFDVEVFSNGVSLQSKIRFALLANRPRLAFSLYSLDEAEHDAVTGVRGSFRRTMGAMDWCAREGLAVRVAMIGVTHSLSTMREAEGKLASVGVSRVTYHRVQAVGRATETQTFAEMGPDRCGLCGHGMICVSGNGDVSECVFSRDRKLGRVGEGSYIEMLHV